MESGTVITTVTSTVPSTQATQTVTQTVSTADMMSATSAGVLALAVKFDRAIMTTSCRIAAKNSLKIRVYLQPHSIGFHHNSINGHNLAVKSQKRQVRFRQM